MPDCQYISFSINDLLVNADVQARLLENACNRAVRKKAQAVCQVGETVVVPLVPCARGEYVTDVKWVEFHSSDPEELIGILSQRWQGGYDAAGLARQQTSQDSPYFLLVQKVVKYAD